MLQAIPSVFTAPARTLTAVVALAVMAVTACAAPEPDPVPRRWQLDVEVAPLRTMVVPIETTGADGNKAVQRMPFAYTTYTVTNYTDAPVLLAPSFELAFDNGSTAKAGEGVPTAVTAYILGRLENPLLKDQIQVVGNLARGIENAREGLVIWPLTDLDVDEITLYAAGFSGETDRLTLADPETGETEVINLRKTLVMRFATPGTIDPSSTQPLERSARDEWKMR